MFPCCSALWSSPTRSWVAFSCQQHCNCITFALSLCEHRMQTVTGEPLTPTWLPMTSTISVFGLLHFSLHTMTGEDTLSNSSKPSQWKISDMQHCCFYPEFMWKPDWKRKHLLLQMAVPLHVIPWCISRGRQCFWKPAWRPPCILLWLYMLTTVLLHWSLTLPPLQATSLSLSMGTSVLLHQALRQIYL